MNISELEAYLNSHEKVIKAVFPWSTPNEGMTQNADGTVFFVKIYAITGTNLATDQAYVVIVKDKGLQTEACYFKTTLPEFMKTTVFKEQVITAIINYQTAHPELKWYEVNSADEDKKVARVTAYEYNSTEQVLEQKQYLVWDKEGSLQRETVV